MNTTCPHCQTRVNATSAGKCPMCGRAIDVGGDDVSDLSYFDVIDDGLDPAVDAIEVVCPMCGTVMSVSEGSCPNCGENVLAFDGELWRQGHQFLIMHKSAELPLRCVKTNQPCSRQLKRNLSWHHPAWYLLIIACGLIPYVIAALIVRKTATIHVGLCEEWFTRRRNAIIIGSVSTLLGIVLVISGAIVVDNADAAGGAMIFLGLIVFLFGLIFGLVRSRVVEVKKFEGDYIWLKGCHADYLAPLPEWTGGMQ